MRRAFYFLAAFASACGNDPAPSGQPDAATQNFPDAAPTADATASQPDAAVLEDAANRQEDATAVNEDAAAVPEDSGVPEGNPYPDPSAWGPNRGPGGPNVTFTEAQLYQNCSYLEGGQRDVDHHNLALMFDGYLLLPWAPEFRRGGLTFFDISDPCLPTVAGTEYSEEMRETHSVGLAEINGRWYAAVNGMRGLNEGGVQVWDVTNTAAPTPVSFFATDGFFYPDAYARVTLSLFWAAPYIFVAAADNGIIVLDARDPMNISKIGEYDFEPTLRAGQVQVVGNLLFTSAAEGPRAVLLDVSDPTSPQPVPGGDFLTEDETNTPRESYFSTMGGGYTYYARKDGGGGLMIYDIHDPSMPAFSGAIASGGNGGYVFVKDNFAFVGEGSAAVIYDITQHNAITHVADLHLTGDLDTITPIGNIAVLSVDADAETGRGSALAPYQMEVDVLPPSVTWSWPSDQSTGIPLTSMVGVTFNELVDPKSLHAGSVRLYETGTNPAVTRVDGQLSGQELIANFSPRAPLRAGTRYTLEIPAGGVADYNGNTIDVPFTLEFTTAQ